MATVLYPGSFDPVHLGHLDVIEQALELFGHVVVARCTTRRSPAGMFTARRAARDDRRGRRIDRRDGRTVRSSRSPASPSTPLGNTASTSS
jgi:cytidyltransferase-like protein